MRRRECFALPLILAGCGGSDVEFQIQPSPLLRTSKNVFPQGVENIWTPTLTFATPGDFTVTYSFNEGRYFRLGSFVFAFFQITSTSNSFDHTTASGALRIQGLPRQVLPPSSGDAFSGGSLAWAGVTDVLYTQLTPYAVAAETYAEIYMSGSGQVQAVLSASDMPTNGTIRLRGFVVYTAADIS